MRVSSMICVFRYLSAAYEAKASTMSYFDPFLGRAFGLFDARSSSTRHRAKHLNLLGFPMKTTMSISLVLPTG